MEASLMYRLCLLLLRIAARVVPKRDRDAWLAEWRNELDYWLEKRRRTGKRHAGAELNMLRRTSGSFVDAAWLRRQFTRDADIVHDLRHGARVLRRRPGFAAAAILVLALGIGVTLGIFAVADTLLVRALPYANAERIVMVWQGRADEPETRDDVAPANCLDWRQRLTQSFDAFACIAPFSFDYTGGAEPVVLHAAAVTDEFFRVLGTEAILGRTFASEEYLGASGRVVLVTHELWRRALGGNPAVVGTSITLDGEPGTIVGVLPPELDPRVVQSSSRSDNLSLYIPLRLDGPAAREAITNREDVFWNAIGRLRPSATIERAQAELDAVSRQLAAEYPRTNARIVARAQPFRDHVTGNLRPALRLLMAAVGVLLLIAAANVANLLLARAAERDNELAIRSAAGAGRARLVRQLLAESLLLAAIGCAAGLVVAWWTIRVIVALSPTTLPALAGVSIDSRIVLLSIVLTLVVALVVGMVPAWQTAGERLAPAAAGLNTSRSGTSRHPLQAAIVIGEVALALLLTTGAALLLRSFTSLLQIEPGFNPDRVVALQVFAWDRNTTPDRRAAFVQQVLDRMREDQRVQEAGAVSAMPFIEANISLATSVRADDRPIQDAVNAFLTIATPSYFSTLQIPVRRGRTFAAEDTPGGQPVAIVSESLARRTWGHTEAVGRRVSFRFQGRMRQAEVVGVVADLRHEALDQPSRAEIFVPHVQYPYGSMTFVARTGGAPAEAVTALKRHIYAVDPLQAVYRSATARELISNTLVERRLLLSLMGSFGVLATLLAAIGIYGVISMRTAQRTREIGVRVALGANRATILRMVMREGMAMALVGLATGLGMTVAFARVVGRFLFELEPHDPATLALSIGVLVTVALVACVVPAHRATRVDPLVALRAE